jgi:hypothetical protein
MIYLCISLALLALALTANTIRHSRRYDRERR